jgi:branched-chain amino acid transport system substrate-binding protein
MPYTGTNVAYDVIGKVQVAYFTKVNRSGGIRGRDVNLVSMDDSSSPAVALEQVRMLVEQYQVIAMLTPVGDDVNTTIRGYLNEHKVPQLFAAGGASALNDPQRYPWTIGFRPSYELEGKTYAEHIKKTNPKAKVAVLYRNDPGSKEVLAGLTSGLGGKPKIIAQASYEPRAAISTAQLSALKRARPDTLVGIGDRALTMQTVAQLDGPVALYLAADDASATSALQGAAAVPTRSVITGTYFKDPADQRWQNDPGVKEYLEFLKADYPYGNPSDARIAYAYLTAQILAQILSDCGDDLTAANVMKKATALQGLAPGLLLPGVTISTSSTDFLPVDELKLLKVDGAAFAVVD